ncbi:hypothetical protein MHYP_G00145560 [Metynnis hypsauchen]
MAQSGSGSLQEELWSGVDCVELTQSDSKLVKPGESFSISCKTTESGYCVHWIQQSAGKTLEWLGYLCKDDRKSLIDKVKSKISFHQDKSSSTVFLQGQNFQSEDTAVYYCARQPQRYNHPADLNKNTLNSSHVHLSILLHVHFYLISVHGLTRI